MCLMQGWLAQRLLQVTCGVCLRRPGQRLRRSAVQEIDGDCAAPAAPASVAQITASMLGLAWPV